MNMIKRQVQGGIIAKIFTSPQAAWIPLPVTVPTEVPSTEYRREAIPATLVSPRPSRFLVGELLLGEIRSPLHGHSAAMPSALAISPVLQWLDHLWPGPGSHEEAAAWRNQCWPTWSCHHQSPGFLLRYLASGRPSPQPSPPHPSPTYPTAD